MAGLSVLVLVAPKNLGEWDPDYENGRRHFYEETAVGRETPRAGEAPSTRETNERGSVRPALRHRGFDSSRSGRLIRHGA